MPKQSRLGGTSSDQWKRQLPQDIREHLVYIETVAFKDKSGQPSIFLVRCLLQSAFSTFVLTDGCLYVTDNKARVQSTYPLLSIVDFDRSSQADAQKMFLDEDIQSDAVKYLIIADPKAGNIPARTEFYTYFFDSLLYFFLRQTWLHCIFV